MAQPDHWRRTVGRVVAIMRWAAHVLRHDPRRADDVQRVLEHAADEVEQELNGEELAKPSE